MRFQPVFLATFFIAAASAQTVPFRLLVTEANSAITVQSGATLGFEAQVGQTVTAQVVATYTGTGVVTIPTQPNLLGATSFTSTLQGSLPLTLNSNSSATFTIQFSPTTPAQANAALGLAYSETIPPATSGGSVTTTNSAITLTLQGTAPTFVLSYILQANNNVVSIANGGTIPFPATLVNGTSQAALNITNTGSGTGAVASVTISGSAFKLSGTPLFPYSIAAGSSLQIIVLYQPVAVETDTGQVQITYDSGATATLKLQGNSTAATFVYQVQSTPPVSVASGGTVTLPSVNVGQTTSVVLKITNAGTANGSITSLAVSGSAFQLANPPALPQTLLPNASLVVTLNFTPAQAGTLTGSLFINSDTLILSGVGLGSQLTFSYVVAGTAVVLTTSNNSVVFSPVTIGQSAQVSLDVKNTGTLAATISNIGVGQAGSPYAISPVSLPMTLNPGADFQLTITFTPTTVGFSDASLIFDTTSIGLVGSGTQPPTLPAYTISGPSGTAAPQSQPVISLTLAQAYPVAVTGTLTLSFNAGTLKADPAVQFANGSQTISFLIPANSTQAQFGAFGTSIGLQTGTVAGTLTLTPSFATQAGGVNITPASPGVLQFSVAPAAPVLVAIAITNVTSTGFTVTLTGYTTTRALTTCALQLTAAQGYTLPTTQFTVNLQPISAVWFEGSASVAFGGQFIVSIPFTFQGTPPSGQTLVSSIAGVSATMGNALGTSNALQVNVQ